MRLWACLYPGAGERCTDPGQAGCAVTGLEQPAPGGSTTELRDTMSKERSHNLAGVLAGRPTWEAELAPRAMKLLFGWRAPAPS